MNKIAINTFDVRLSYLTEKEIEQWNSLNQLARTLWFENTISGPDLEYSRFSVEIFKLYPHYCTWSHVPRQNGGYVLQNNSPDSTLTINADLMNGWWNIFKRLTNGKLTSTTRSANTFQLYKDYYQLPDSEIANTLSKNFGHNQGVWDTFLKYLNYVYTIGNLSPSGANPGGGLDLWTNKLSKLKQQWFDQESEIRQEIYNNHNSNNKKCDKSCRYYFSTKSFIPSYFKKLFGYDMPKCQTSYYGYSNLNGRNCRFLYLSYENLSFPFPPFVLYFLGIHLPKDGSSWIPIANNNCFFIIYQIV